MGSPHHISQSFFLPRSALCPTLWRVGVGAGEHTYHIEKWSISCCINKQGCHNHQGVRPSKREFLSVKGAQKEKCLLSDSNRATASSYRALRPWEMWKKHRTLAPDSWKALERNDFREPRFSHLPVHRKALNSLTWDIWFSLINNNLLKFRLPVPCCQFLYNLTPPLLRWNSSLRISWDTVSQAWNPKTSHQIKHNSQLVGCEVFSFFFFTLT